jgi:hypothetical protein
MALQNDSFNFLNFLSLRYFRTTDIVLQLGSWIKFQFWILFSHLLLYFLHMLRGFPHRTQTPISWPGLGSFEMANIYITKNSSAWVRERNMFDNGLTSYPIQIGSIMDKVSFGYASVWGYFSVSVVLQCTNVPHSCEQERQRSLTPWAKTGKHCRKNLRSLMSFFLPDIEDSTKIKTCNCSQVIVFVLQICLTNIVLT